MVYLINDLDAGFEERLTEWRRREERNRRLGDFYARGLDKAAREIRNEIDAEERERISKRWDELFISLSLYLYDHSGITIRTSPFSCPWDSGQVGFIYASLAKVRETYQVKSVTKKVRERAIEGLKAEVTEYDQFLTGDIYGFQIEKLERDEIASDTVDVTDDALDWAGDESCWGFYGTDPEKSGMAWHAGDHRLEALKKAFSNIGTWVECPADPEPTSPTAAPPQNG